MTKYKITIPFSENDLQEMLNGGIHEWTFPVKYHKDIEVECTIINEDYLQ